MVCCVRGRVERSAAPTRARVPSLEGGCGGRYLVSTRPLAPTLSPQGRRSKAARAVCGVGVDFVDQHLDVVGVESGVMPWLRLKI